MRTKKFLDGTPKEMFFAALVYAALPFIMLLNRLSDPNPPRLFGYPVPKAFR